ncbi:TRAP transporter substrate-binding protein [Synechococcus sp. MIT S9451]|uniref:TRAP transporter substrate-binding protein n=1 Tax=Synechococcus sp. MIT S9451 TaxID=3082543 RepID=UPI0012197A15|nr:MAG: ABC transporter substrate-binding protein [Synechococcus sp. MED-G135]
MQRRQLLRTSGKALAAAAGAGALSACTIRRAEHNRSSGLPQVRWRMATSWPVSLDTIYGGAETICKRVEVMSGGGFQIEPFAAGEIVPGLEVLDAVQAGSVECGHTASYYFIGKNPAFAFGTAVPFGLSAQQQNAWLYQGGGNEAMDALFADFGAKSFPAGNTGGQLGGWFKRPVEGLASLKGLKMRIPGLGGKVMARLGVNVQVLPGGEIYLALERGAIDAAEFTGPYDDEKLGLPKAAKYYYYPGWWEPGPSLTALVNRKAWADLPEEYKAMFSTACYEANLGMLSKYEQRNSEALLRLRRQGIKLEVYSDDILKAAHEATGEMFAELAADDPGFRDLLERWRLFRRETLNWNRINELPLAQFNTNTDEVSP